MTDGHATERLNALVKLQRIDTEIATCRAEIERLRATLAGDTVLDDLRGKLEARQRELAASQSAGRAVEADVSDTADRAKRLEKRLYGGSVGNPQELLGMQHELEILKSRLAELEETLLERMEETESAEAAMAAAKVEVEQREQERTQDSGPQREKLEKNQARLQELDTSRAAAVTEIEAAMLRIYEHIRGKKQPAVVSLDGEKCGGCHLPLSAHVVHQVKSQELVQCSNCDRIVVP